MPLETGEVRYLDGLENKIRSLRDALAMGIPELKSLEIPTTYRWLVGIKTILGNFNNDVSFIGALMAKDFLLNRHRISGLDVSLKAQGAAGFDIEVTAANGDRIVAEVKTTIPYAGTKLGAKQAEMFRKDFAKLAAVKTRFRYFFVTEKEAFDATLRKYGTDLEGITVVLLPNGISDERYVRTL